MEGRFIVGSGGDEGRASSEEGVDESPHIFEVGASAENDVGADEGFVGIGTPIEGGNKFRDSLLNRLPKVRG